MRRLTFLFVGLALLSRVAAAQTPAAVPAMGGMIVRATRISTPIRIDGRLDEAVYTTVAPMTNFLQTEPSPGAPATEKTEVWLLFDTDRMFVTVRCWETHPERRVANEMRRDSTGVSMGNDNIAFMFDTFHDKQNAVTFAVNPLGGFGDGQVTNQRQYNGDFNPVWTVKAGRFEQGWTFEAAIPFKSLRYGPGRSQTWGFNVVRTVRWKNETSYLSRVPESIGGNAGIMYSSYAATVDGLEAPPVHKTIEVKPYVTSGVATDRAAVPRINNDFNTDGGGDVKYGVTQNMTADLTVNTDFAQVEADEQQVNLTRFNLFFPEKREFFLENQGVFSFGGVQGAGGDTPTLFYSRRIGLNGGRVVPIGGGGRLTGRAGRFTIGALDIESRDDDLAKAKATNFSVVRVKRDVFRKSNIGLLATSRSLAQAGSGSNTAYGVDGTFAFGNSLYINSYWARTDSTTPGRDDRSYRAQLDYAADRYGVQLEHLHIGDAFNPDIGFVRRSDVRKSYGLFRFSPRLLHHKTIRKLSGTGTFSYIENGRGRLDTRDSDAAFGIEFQSSDKLTVSAHQTYEYIPAPFRIAPAVTVPVGGYDYANFHSAYAFGQQRPVFGTVSFDRGTFYAGHKTTVGLSGGRVKVLTRLSVEPTFSINRVDLPQGRFTTRVIGSRVTYTMTPRMFTSALLQYSSSSNVLALNARLRWEYQPGSELFVVFNEQRHILGPSFSELSNRSFIVKVNRLFRF